MFRTHLNQPYNEIRNEYFWYTKWRKDKILTFKWKNKLYRFGLHSEKINLVQ